jgi:hypothetical protein
VSPILAVGQAKPRRTSRSTLVLVWSTLCFTVLGLAVALILPWTTQVRFRTGKRTWSIHAYWLWPQEATPQGYSRMPMQRRPFVDYHDFRIGNADYHAAEYEGMPDVHWFAGQVQVETDPHPNPNLIP